MSEDGEAPVAGSKRKDPPSPSTSDDEFDENEGRLSWRMDPEESYSDWTIETTLNGKSHGIYHVHKSMLAVRSEYFARLFSNKDLKEHEMQRSRIELEELAAKAFPVLLDFVYSLWDDDKTLITHENAVALHHLGGYFEVRGLRKKARDFWKKRMTDVQLGTYFEHSKLFHDEKVYRAVVEKCWSSACAIKSDSRLMEVSDAQFWLDVLKQNQGNPNPALSPLISDFCSMQKEQLDAETFLRLTDMTLLPELSAHAVIQLMELEQFFMPAIVSADELSNLQERGLGTLKSYRKKSPRGFALLQCRFKNLTPLFLSKMLVQASEEMRLTLGKLKKSEVKLQCFLPKRVVVSGASIIFATGTYALTGKFVGGAPCFRMDKLGYHSVLVLARSNVVHIIA